MADRVDVLARTECPQQVGYSLRQFEQSAACGVETVGVEVGMGVQSCGRSVDPELIVELVDRCCVVGIGRINKDADGEHDEPRVELRHAQIVLARIVNPGNSCESAEDVDGPSDQHRHGDA